LHQANTQDNRVATGIAGVDDILGGGLPPNRLYLIQGDPGTGKTTLALQYLLEGRRAGESVLYITLSETEEELRAVADSHGWDLDGVHLYELTAAEQNKTTDANTLFHPSEIELTETTEGLLAQVEKVQPTRVVLDSLSELRLLAQNSLRYRRQILALKQYFAGKRCSVLLLDDRTSDAGDLQVQSLAHGVIALEHRAPEFGTDRRRIRIVKMRGVRFRGGFHDYVIRRGGLDVYPRLIAAEHRSGFDHGVVLSGLKELDTLLGGGVARGMSMLLMGPAGSGKSTLAMQYMAAAAERGEHCSVFMFDEAMETLLMRADSMNMKIREHVKSGKIHLRQVDPAELPPGELAQHIRTAVERDGASIIVIDSLNGYLNAMPDERFLTIQLHELLMYLSQKGVLTLLVVAQHGVMGRMDSPIDVSYLSDAVLLLRYFEAAGAVRQAISVLKNRSGKHERTIREFKLGQGGVSLGEPLVNFHGVLTGVPTYTGPADQFQKRVQ
jgi:circadian clock protein KaiC